MFLTPIWPTFESMFFCQQVFEVFLMPHATYLDSKGMYTLSIWPRICGNHVSWRRFSKPSPPPLEKPQDIVFEFVSLWCQDSLSICVNIEKPTSMQSWIEKETWMWARSSYFNHGCPWCNIWCISFLNRKRKHRTKVGYWNGKDHNVVGSPKYRSVTSQNN